MNEFKEILKEAFVGEEPYDPSPDRGRLQAAIRAFEARDRILRWMLWFAVTFMSVVAVWAAWSFASADAETSTKSLVLYATAFLFASTCVGYAKLMLFTAQRGFSIMKELKRTQLTLLEMRE